MADDSSDGSEWTSAGEEQDEDEIVTGPKWPPPLSPRIIVTRAKSANE